VLSAAEIKSKAISDLKNGLNIFSIPFCLLLFI